MEEIKYTFDDDHKNESKSQGILNFIWNSRTKEFCGRDGASWAKVSFFYAIFYTCLGGFFIGMLAVFMSMIPLDKPTYYGDSSSMGVRNLNPGLGFRPQINVEDHTIVFDPKVDVHEAHGIQLYKRNLDFFLKTKYDNVDKNNLIKCEQNTSYINEFNQGKSCEFDYETIYQNTPCTSEKSYGFKDGKPCVLIKLNKIVSWVPNPRDEDPNNIVIKCAGENAFDSDNIKGVTYYSEGDSESNVHGFISTKYYPFMGQKNYRAPFIFASFDVTPNTIVNIECKAYAKNIDNTDRLNRRGQTKFTLYVKNN